MAHATGDRTGWDTIVDMLKPRLEHTLREHGGRVIFAIPALGDALKYAVRRFGAKPFANAVLVGGGYAKFPRRWFRPGTVGDRLQRLANEAVDEFAQAIAKQGLDASPEELEGTIDQVMARLRGKADGETPEGREIVEMVIVQTMKEGDLVRRESHHRNCVDLPPLVLADSFRDQRGQQRERKKPNPALREMPRDHAKAQGIPEHVDCMPIFETEKTKQAPAAKTGGKQKKPAEIIAELTDSERKKLLDKLKALTPEERAHVMHEFEERLTSVEELRGVLALSDATSLPEAVGLLKDKFQERVEGALRWVGGRAQAAEDNLRAAAAQSAQGLAAARQQLAGVKARLRAKLG